MANDERAIFEAYRVHPEPEWVIEPSSRDHDWMADAKHAYWCLPLTMANQSGWIVRSPCSCKVCWSGKESPDGITFEYGEDEGVIRPFLGGGFGHGILSIVLPFVFRTPRGIGVWARGIPNEHYPDVAPMEGLVETDWAPYSFTMNYRVTKRKSTVYFSKGQPLVMLTPFPLDLLEGFDTRIRMLYENPELEAKFAEFSRERVRTRRKQAQNADKNVYRPKLDYMRGADTHGSEISSAFHRTSLKLKRFD